MYNNFINMGFNMNSPIVQNTLGGNYVPPNFNMPIASGGYNNVYVPSPMQQPMMQQNGYVDPNAMQQNTFSPFVTNTSPLGFNYNNMPNSSFYNGLYNQYYNPYMERIQMQQQAQIQAIEAKQRAEAESRIWKGISRGLNNISDCPIENIEDHLKQYDPIDPNQVMLNQMKSTKNTLRVKLVTETITENEEIKEEVICDPKAVGYYETQEQMRNYYGFNFIRQDKENTMRLTNVELFGIPYNIELARKVEYNNSMYDAHKKEFGDDMGLIEYLNKAGILYSNALVYENMMRKMNLTNNYNQNNFRNKLLDGKNLNEQYFAQTFGNMNSEYTGIYPGPTLGSLEVTVPNRLRNKYEERRAQFLNSILSQ